MSSLAGSDLTREGDKPFTSLNAVYQSSKCFLDLSCAAQKTWIGIHIARGAALVLQGAGISARSSKRIANRSCSYTCFLLSASRINLW